MKIFCIAANYRKHNEEINLSPDQTPIMFIKPETALLRNGFDFYIPEFSKQVEYETEIVLKISRVGKCVDKKFAHRYYDQVTVGLDITARDLQTEARQKGLPWFLSKGFDSSSPMGEFLDLAKVGPIDNIDFSLKINGEVRQQGNTRDMIFHCDEIVSYISQFCMLKQGDYIFTGTPAGVGKLNIGDHLEGFIGQEKVLDTHVK